MVVVQFPARHRADAPDLARQPQFHPSDPAGANVVSLWGGYSWSEELSDYDRQNIHLYARLLHDESEGAGEDDLARDVLGLDPYRSRSRALKTLRAHMERARWIRNTLFPMLGW